MSGRLLPLLLVALLLAALAGALASVAGPRAYLPRLLLLGAIGSFVLFLVRARGDILFLLGRARRTAEPGPASTWLLAAIVLILASVVFGRVPVRADLTARGLNRLSEASRQIVRAAEAPIELIGVYRETSPDRERAVDLLEVYRVASTRIRTRMLDPDRSPEEARGLGVTRAGVILVRSGSVQEEVDELTESDITEAILRVENPRRTVIAFTTGHGEPKLTDGSPGGLARFAKTLRDAGYEPVETTLYDQPIPDEAAALAIVGPQRALLSNEVERIGAYLDRGGRVLLALEPGTTIGLEGTLASRGIGLDSLEVEDESAPTRGLGMGPRVLLVTTYANHPIVAAGMGWTVFPGARAIHLSREGLWGIEGATLFQTGPDARLVAPRGEAAQGPRGAQPLAVVEEWETPGAAEPVAGTTAREKPYGRLFVVGDSGWLTGQYLDLFSNRDLALRAVHWLARREFLLKIPPIDVTGTPLRISLTGIRTLVYLLQLVLPLALLGAGLWIWTRKR
ncbi:MAG: DUF4350 domain-containing protein [Candidatus Eisenbacteria bacterium]